MIDPSIITDYNCNVQKLQEHILFWVLAANKNGSIAAKKLSILLKIIRLAYEQELSVKSPKKPFNLIKQYDKIASNYNWLAIFMRQIKTGEHNKKSKTILDLVYSDINLKTCSFEELESIKGIGKKTSHCFVIHTRPNTWNAGLDRHALRFLRENGYPQAPKQTPQSNKEYKHWEKIFLTFVPTGWDDAKWDLNNWNNYKTQIK